MARIIPLVVFSAFFLYRFRLPAAWPQGIRDQDLIGAFRQAGYVASGGGRGVTVRLGKAAAVSFPPDKDGRLKGRYVVDATGYAYTASFSRSCSGPWPFSPSSLSSTTP